MTGGTTKPSGIRPREVLDLSDLAALNDDSIVSRTLLNTAAGSVTLFVFAAGQQLSEHTAPYDALAHVIDGAAEILIGGDTFNVEAGQVVLMPAGVPHAVNAKQEFTMMLTMFKVSD